MTSRMTPLLEHNEQFARAFTPVPLGLPTAQVILITCLDHRVDPALTLGLKLGDAPVLRNAGGRVTEPVIEEIAYLAFLGRRLAGGPVDGDKSVEVAVIHHTQCGGGPRSLRRRRPAHHRRRRRRAPARLTLAPAADERLRSRVRRRNRARHHRA
jgi:carbonic anhydrase